MTINYAFLDENSIVKQVLLFDSYDKNLLDQIRDHLNLDSYIESTDINPASVDGEFYKQKFYPKKIYNSWIRNENLAIWEPPVQYPNDGMSYIWNEELGNWQEIPE